MSHCAKIVFFFVCKILGMSEMRFSKRKLHSLFFPLLCWRNRTEQRKKGKWKRQQNPIKLEFLRWSSKMWKIINVFFWQKLPDTICVRKGQEKRAFRAHYLFWPKNIFGPKQWKPGKTIKNSSFSGNCPKPKMTPFFGRKVFFWHGWKSGFY